MIPITRLPPEPPPTSSTFHYQRDIITIMAQMWYYRIDEEPLGPVTAVRLKELATSGKIGTDTMVRSSEGDQWVRASRIRGLFNVSHPHPDSTSASKEDANDTDTYRVVEHERKTDPSQMLAASKSTTKTGSNNSVYLEVRSRDGTRRKFRSVEDVRAALLEGALTRHDKSRWVEPAPDPKIFDRKARAYEEVGLQIETFLVGVASENEREVDFSMDRITDSANTRASEEFDFEQAVWERRNKWRPIGKGLAQEDDRIRSLYTPALNHMGKARSIFWITYILVVGALFTAFVAALFHEAWLLSVVAFLSFGAAAMVAAIAYSVSFRIASGFERVFPSVLPPDDNYAWNDDVHHDEELRAIGDAYERTRTRIRRARQTT